MFSLFKRKTPAPSTAPSSQAAQVASQAWLGRLRSGLQRTGSSIAGVFGGKVIDDALYEELESALLMSDAGMAATQHVLQALKQKVKAAGSKDPADVKAMLVLVLADLLRPLEGEMRLDQHKPTVIMVAGVNGAGKTTSIGKLTRHLNDAVPVCCWQLRIRFVRLPKNSCWSGPTATRSTSSAKTMATRLR
jgi:fused signal recognition particle receptor